MTRFLLAPDPPKDSPSGARQAYAISTLYRLLSPLAISILACVLSQTQFARAWVQVLLPCAVMAIGHPRL
jgi:hypothetical protein